MAEILLDELLEKYRSFDKLIEDDEREYTAKIESVARKVCESGKIRIILLAGPSASGKTTTANLISDKIKSFGEKSMVVSLDNFYRNSDDPAYPKLSDGTRDFESPYALDLDTLIKTLGDIIDGREFDVPKYDFKVGGRVETTHYPSYKDGCVVIEGIHGLNPILSDPFPKECVLKMFVSVSTNVNSDGERILSGRKLRFVRRMVRDNVYRASDPKRTLSMWKNVLLGEDMHLYPYKHLADVMFDTFHTFELGVLKPYACELLTDEVTSESDYAAAVSKAFSKIPKMPEQSVPQTSLIREFITGGIYEDLY